jgi:hypothetical protein
VPRPAEAEKSATEKAAEAEAPPRPSARNTRGRRPTSRRPPPVRETPPAAAEEQKPVPPVQEPEVEIGPRLIIETNDGTLINRSMSTVKRVNIENGQVVVTGKDGKISRVLLINVVRMTIAP